MAYTGGHLTEKKHRVQAAWTRIWQAWTAARTWVTALRLPVRDAGQPSVHQGATDLPRIPAAAPVVVQPASQPMPPLEFVAQLHDVCGYLPGGLRWQVRPGLALLILGPLDAGNDRLREIVHLYGIALKAGPMLYPLGDGAGRLVVDAAFDAVQLRVVVDATLAAECDVVLRIEQAAHAAMDDTQVFDAIPADLVDVPDVGMARLVGAALGAREVD